MRFKPEVREQLLSAARALRPVPAPFAAYCTAPEVAWRYLKFDEALLAEFARAGVPHQTDSAGRPLFDYTDLLNIGAESRSGVTVPELAQRFLVQFLLAGPAEWFGERTWEVRVRPPDGSAQSGSGEWELRPVDREAPGVTWRGDLPAQRGGSSGFRVTLTGRFDAVADPGALRAYAETLDDLAGGDVRYLTVPEVLRDDPARAWAEGMADCVVVSRRLARKLVALGHRARARRGYLLGVLGSDHAWTELWEDGRWKCLDAVFELLALRREAGDEIRKACRGSRFNRLLPCATHDAEPLVCRDGGRVPAWALASVSATLVPDA